MPRFVIHGGRPLRGRFRPVGNKNAALPMLAASLLTDEAVVLHNVPAIEDVRVLLELLSFLGVSAAREGHTVRLCARGARPRDLPEALCRRVRASILLAGPLVARHGLARLHPPGGDVIGRRRLDTHFEGFRGLGMEADTGPGAPITLRRRAPHGADLLLDEASVTATENLLMAAALTPGRTTLFPAACEPHVADLGELLRRMGARIEGLGTNRVVVEGVGELHGAEHTVGFDYVEAGSVIAAAAVTGGELTVEGVEDGLPLRVLARSFERLGVRWHMEDDLLHVPPAGLAVAGDPETGLLRIEDGVWPAFPSDMMSVAIVVATQAAGSVLFFEKLFESRMYFVDRLLDMGAGIVQCDPHRVVVQGPRPLHGTYLSSPDIRAGMALIVAALCARGVSTIEGAHMVDRGYERVDERLRALGADLVRED